MAQLSHGGSHMSAPPCAGPGDDFGSSYDFASNGIEPDALEAAFNDMASSNPHWLKRESVSSSSNSSILPSFFLYFVFNF